VPKIRKIGYGLTKICLKNHRLFFSGHRVFSLLLLSILFVCLFDQSDHPLINLYVDKAESLSHVHQTSCSYSPGSRLGLLV